MRKFWLTYLPPKIRPSGAVNKSIETEAYKSLVQRGACEIKSLPTVLEKKELNELLQKLHRPRATSADSFFTYKYVLACGKDLEKDGTQEEEASTVKKLWDAAVSMRATNGSREGAAARLANGMGMAFAPGVPGVWPLDETKRYTMTSYQVKQLDSLIERTPLVNNHDFDQHHVMMDLDISTTGPTISPTSGCGLQNRLQGHSTKVTTIQQDTQEAASVYSLWKEDVSLKEAIRQTVGEVSWQLIFLQITKMKYERIKEEKVHTKVRTYFEIDSLLSFIFIGCDFVCVCVSTRLFKCDRSFNLKKTGFST